MPTEKEKMLAGELYNAMDAEIQADQQEAAEWMADYNSAIAMPEKRTELLQKRFGSIGQNVTIRPPFHCDYGFNIHLGDNVFLNFNCVILDVVKVEIGDGTQIGPAVQIYTADHPRDLETRASGLEFGKPVKIGKNVWIGGGAIILPGVAIGDHAVIGAGSVVTRDIPEKAIAFGNPARVSMPRVSIPRV